MKMLALAVLAVSTHAFAADPLPPSELIRLENEISVHLTELDGSFANVTALTNQALLLHAGVDAKATALRMLAARCATSCSAADRNAMGIAANDLLLSQQATTAQLLHLQVALQNENRLYQSIANVLRTKHDTVKNSISN